DVGEAKATTRPGNGPYQARGLGLLERLDHLVLGESARSLECVDAELPSDNRCEHEQITATLRGGSEPPADRLGDAGRNGCRGAVIHLPGGQEAPGFDVEQGVSSTALMHPVGQLARGGDSGGELEQASGLVHAESTQREAVRRALAGQLGKSLAKARVD